MELFEKQKLRSDIQKNHFRGGPYIVRHLLSTCKSVCNNQIQRYKSYQVSDYLIEKPIGKYKIENTKKYQLKMFKINVTKTFLNRILQGR